MTSILSTRAIGAHAQAHIRQRGPATWDELTRWLGDQAAIDPLRAREALLAAVRSGRLEAIDGELLALAKRTEKRTAA